MLLTTEERKRFVVYCRAQSESCALIAEQFTKLPLAQHSEEFAKIQRMKAAGYQIVADDLEIVEEQTIRG